MKRLKIFIITVLLLVGIHVFRTTTDSPLLVGAVTILPGSGGGTGISTSTAANDNNCLTQSSSTPLLKWTIGTCGSGGSANGDFTSQWVTNGTTLNGSSTYSLFQMFGIASSSQLRSPSGTITALTFVNASGTNQTLSGYLRAGDASTTNITASGYGLFPTLGFTNSSGTNLTVSGYLRAGDVSSTNVTASGYGIFPALFDFQGNKYSTSTGGGSGSVSTSSPITVNTFPFWTSTAGALSGSSTLMVNASGSIAVGTTTATARFHVLGQSSSTGSGTVAASSSGEFFNTTITGTANFPIQVNVGDMLFAGAQSRMITAIGSSTALFTDYAFSPLFAATSWEYQQPILRIETASSSPTLTITADGVVRADNSSFGYPVFPEDSGFVSWIDMSVSSTLLNVPVGYTANIDGNPLMTLFGLSDGTGGVVRMGVAIGTTTATNALLTVGSSSMETTTSSLVFFGDGGWINGGSASGTVLGMNMVNTSYNGDFLNFQINSSTIWGLTNKGHINGSSTAPVLSSCGTSPVIIGTDAKGTVTAGATAAACTITFNKAYTTDPVCVVSEQTGSVVNTFSYTHSSTTIVVTQTGLAGVLFDYLCMGNPS